MKTVLFACVHNAGRSQMAAAWFNALADSQIARAISAGTEPGTRVHPEVLAAMKEVGIDLSNVQPTFLTHRARRQFEPTGDDGLRREVPGRSRAAARRLAARGSEGETGRTGPRDS